MSALVLACALLSMSATSTAVPTQTTGDFDALRQKADEARAAGRIDDAVAFYKRALALQPSWTEGYWYLGTIYYDADRHRECRDAFARVVEQQPKHGAAWAFRGLCEFKLKEYTAALEHLDQAKKLGVGEDADFVAVVGYHRAILLIRAGSFEAAVDEIRSFIRGGNTEPTIVEALGLALLRLSQLPSEVTPEAREMVQLAGQAAILAYRRMTEAAEQTYAQLVTRYPHVPNVHYVHGAYLVHERPDQALEQFKLELERSPYHVLARVQIAQELIKRGDFDGATLYATEAARLAPRNFLARKVLGQIRLQAGDAAGAIAELEAARTLEPTSPSVRFQLARAYQRAGRGEDANRERAEFRRLEALQQTQRGANTMGEPTDQP